MSKICLCGSYSDKEYIYNIGRFLLPYHSILIPAFYLGRRPTPEEQNSLMTTHFDRISSSNKVLAICKTKVGANTLIEIGYALARNKNVIILASRDIDIPDEFINYSNFILLRITITDSHLEEILRWAR